MVKYHNLITQDRFAVCFLMRLRYLLFKQLSSKYTPAVPVHFFAIKIAFAFISLLNGCVQKLYLFAGSKKCTQNMMQSRFIQSIKLIRIITKLKTELL